MKILILGAAGFIGTNLAITLSRDAKNEITLVDVKKEYFDEIKKYNLDNVIIKEATFSEETDFDSLLMGQDVVYHLVSTTVPTTSNQHIEQEIKANVIVTIKMLDSCVKQKVKKVVFISSGGTVYGKEASCPICEDTATNPISAYGIQKVTIEKLLYLYNHLHGLDYRVIRLSNPYGPHQRPNGILGAVTTFTHRAITGQEIVVYGDGCVVRDYIYIDDAIAAIINIANGESKHKTFNVGSGNGTSVKELLEQIEKTLKCKLNITYAEERKVDVPINYLDVSRYESQYGTLSKVSLEEGILKLAEFLRKNL